MLAWLKEGKHQVNLGGKGETSARGCLLQLLPKVEDAELRAETEENLKKKAKLKLYARSEGQLYFLNLPSVNKVKFFNDLDVLCLQGILARFFLQLVFHHR